jgi:hypothetical protein
VGQEGRCVRALAASQGLEPALVAQRGNARGGVLASPA